jgi:hypothetical protein
MSLTLLYYPHIEVPSNWLKQALLYTDNIASIVPHGFWGSEDMHVLQTEGLYHPISPHEYLERHSTLIENDVFQMVESLKNNRYNVHLPKGHHEILHVLKFTEPILTMLREEGLAISQDTNWERIDSDFAFAYMTVLARHLASAYGYVPTTTSTRYENLLVDRQRTPCTSFKVMKLLFRNILPVPSSETSITDILSFKRQRSEELLRFRLEIGQFSKYVRQCHSEEEIQEACQQFQDRVALNLEEITRLIRENRINFTLNSLKGLVEANPSSVMALITGAALAIGQHKLSHVSMLSFPFVKGISIGIDYLCHRAMTEHNIYEQPFSYVYYLRREFYRGNL